ncbi:DNA-binding response regulator [Trinickia dabaoshanensis]|uniref:DNA-binding response regulator n=1 Tax=Trinickia dabaoshanensis TaxID=564714 RepID=A0A2N7VC08_9BURK|nr:response regulator transcription factor [Trinickia dabaoshanensis]PMS14685.1 DNA-binding response regulator [Trinickia dabaoshanensis]
MIRVLLADDHAVMRECLLHILEAAQAFVVAGQAHDGESTLALVCETDADVLVLDLTMPAGAGIGLIERVRAANPRLRVLVLSMHAEPHVMERAFRAGATGYLTKESAAVELVAAVRKVACGELYADPGQAGSRQPREGPAARRPQAELTSREREVLHRLAAGESSRRIAQALDLTPQTISTHKKRILEKLALANDAALIRYALRNGFGEDTDDPSRH